MTPRNYRRKVATKVPSQEEIAEETTKLAYQFYVDRGDRQGSDKEDWFRAEKIVKARYNI